MANKFGISCSDIERCEDCPFNNYPMLCKLGIAYVERSFESILHELANEAQSFVNTEGDVYDKEEDESL